jgi:hypothetical protein
VTTYVLWGNWYTVPVKVPWELEMVLVSTADSLEVSPAVLEVAVLASADDDVRLETDETDELEGGGVEELGSCELEVAGSGVELVEGGGVELVEGFGVVVGELLAADVVVGLVLDVLAELLVEPEDDIAAVWLLSLNVA